MSEKKNKRVRRTRKSVSRTFDFSHKKNSKSFAPLESSQSEIVKSILILAAAIDASNVASILAAAGHKNIAEYLQKFDWQSALRLLPHLVEFADSFGDLSGAEKEKKVLALILRIAQMANVAEMVDEDAIESIRIIVATLCDIAKGKFKINAEQKARCFTLSARTLTWFVRHQPCCKSKNSNVEDDNVVR
jgi:hypothetical protein